MSCSLCHNRRPGETLWATKDGKCIQCGIQIESRCSKQEKKPMMHEFPYHTLAYINELVTKLDKTEDKVKLANTVSLHSEIFTSKVSAWALELRLGDLNEPV